MKQKAKLISAKKRKNDLSQELIALGINPKNMSIMKQKKSLKKALERMSNSKLSTMKTTDNSSNNSLSALFADDIPAVITTHSKQKKRKRDNGMTLDLQFGTLIKSDDVFAKQMQEENFIRYGKSGKSITDRHLLRELKAREKRIKVVFKKYTNEHQQHMIIDEHLTQNMVNKIKGKRVKEMNLQYLKKKLKMKHKKKMKSRREWKVRLQKKKRVYSMKIKRRNENLEKHSSKKIEQRIGHRMTDQQLINISSTL